MTEFFKKITRLIILNNRRLFIKFFFSFIVMSVIPVILLGALTYGKVLNIMENHVISANIAFMNQGRNNMDAYISQIHKMQAQLYENNIIRAFYSSKVDNRTDMMFYIKDIRSELNKYGASASEITDVIGIYFPENNVVVTTTSYYEGEAFFKDYRKYKDISYEDCFLKIENSASRQYWKATTVYENKAIPKRVITSVQTIPFYAKGYAYLIALIEEERIWRMFGESNIDDWRNFQGIMDESGELIASSTGELVPDVVYNIDNTLFSDKYGHFEVSADNTVYIVTYTLSGENNWKYFSVIPQSSLMERISLVRNLYLGVILLTLLFSLLFSLFLSQKNYKPVKDIVHLIESNTQEADSQNSSEYKMIHSTISNMFKETREMESKLDSHITISRMHFLLQLLKGMSNPVEINDAIAFYSIDLPFAYYMVAVMEISCYDCHQQDELQRYNNFTRFAASNIAEKALRSKSQAYQVEVDENKIALLINLSEVKAENGNLIIEGILKDIIKALDLNLKLQTSIGIGSAYTSLDRIHLSFHEAMTALDYISIRRDYQIMQYDNIHSYKNSIYYPIAMEQQLFNHVKLGNYEAAESVIDEIYRINFKEREIPVKLAHCLLNNLISSFLKILEELGLDFNEYFNEDISLMPVINNTVSAEKVIEYIKTNLKKLCLHITEKKNSHNVVLRDKIINYIKSRYYDCNISLMSTADCFDVTTPYLSRFFKEQTGYNFNDYLNRFRIEKAKALLREKNASIAEIAEKIGYNSPGTFIRIFKKYESVTPGQYKDSIHET